MRIVRVQLGYPAQSGDLFGSEEKDTFPQKVLLEIDGTRSTRSTGFDGYH